MLATNPSDWARDLIRGSYDLHVHAAPDVMVRRITDVELALRYAELGLAGFVLKSHYTSTAERASVVSAVVHGVDVIGSLTLNASVGGMNPLAVEIAAREGARVVWLPTVDAVNHREKEGVLAAGATPPMWMAVQADLRAKGIEAPVVRVVDEDGKPLPETLEVLRLVAEHGLVLATGHLGRDEIFAVQRAALAARVGKFVVTHPEFPQQQLSVDDQRTLAAGGAFLERCFTTPFTGKCTWEAMADNIRSVGVEHSLISSDLGQPSNPPVEDGVALMADALRGTGFSDDDIRRMTVVNSRYLADRE